MNKPLLLEQFKIGLIDLMNAAGQPVPVIHLTLTTRSDPMDVKTEHTWPTVAIRLQTANELLRALSTAMNTAHTLPAAGNQDTGNPQ